MDMDCHMHMILDGVHWKDAIGRHKDAPDEGFIRQVLSAYRDAGYTYLRDGGDRWGAGKRARELAPEYGIVYRTPLSPLCKKGHYGGFIGECYVNFKEYTGLVRKMRAQGADFIKIMISGLMDFDRFGVLSEEGMPEADIRELIHIAHEEGFAVMAHANGARTIEAAARAGVDSVEHGAYQDGDSLAAMEENGTIWVPTLSTVGNLRGKGRFDEGAVRAILESAQENVSRYRGLIAPGSDAGAWQVFHGGRTEYELLEEALGERFEAAMEQGRRAMIDRF
jgi:imidazolonepropionase-like amidohydrolase